MCENEISFKNVFFTSDDVLYNKYKNSFCGKVFNKLEQIEEYEEDDYLLFVLKNEKLLSDLADFISLENENQLPLIVNDVGIMFNNFFDENHFDALCSEHAFQSLTESTKPGVSYRKGVYITNVEKDENNDLTFKLLRCSTNLDGPTENFRKTDNLILHKLNYFSKYFYKQKVELNHVLAQVYENKIVNGKEKKAKIKDHSDKTKDMPIEGLMAFCTFYNQDIKDVNALTKLRFRLKECVQDEKYIKNFDLVLQNKSVFLMSLKTNRLYTHEIIPSYLNIDKMPTRMGYVVRCSKTISVFKNNSTFIKNGDELVKLEPCTEEQIKSLKELYTQENVSDKQMVYPLINFSLNNGDYKEPML